VTCMVCVGYIAFPKSKQNNLWHSGSRRLKHMRKLMKQGPSAV
jgi:hypothetical protein